MCRSFPEKPLHEMKSGEIGMQSQLRPRLVFFSGPYDHLYKYVLIGLVKPLERLLNHYFDLIVVRGDCDYSEIVEKHEPNMVLFDGGFDNLKKRPTKITNTNTHPQVLKAGLLRNDLHSHMRHDSFFRLESWGVDTFFNYCYRRQESPDGWADRMIYLPLWLNDDIFRDYGEVKSIPVALIGAGFFQGSGYPWRRKVAEKIVDLFPIIHSPRPSYGKNHFIVGEKYARMLNRSFFSLGCGGAAKCLCAKFLEIPGSRSCFVTEPSAIVEALGFVDMKNCVFADETDIVNKLCFLFENRDRLAEITEEGYTLAHNRHTYRNRPQFFQWFQLKQSIPAGYRIIQTGLDEPLQAVPETYRQTRFIPVDDTPDRIHLKKGFAVLNEKKYDEAELLFQDVRKTYVYMPEVHMGIGICSLYKGNLNEAVDRFFYIIKLVQQYNGGIQDPVNFAYCILSLICANQLQAAVNMAEQYSDLKHPFLQVVRWLIPRINPFMEKHPLFQIVPPDDSMTVDTIHPLPKRNFNEWLNHVEEIFRLYGGQKAADLCRLPDAAVTSCSMDESK